MFARLDDWLIKRFEPVAHWVAQSTGVSNFTVAMALLAVWPAIAGADALAKQTATEWVMAGLVLIVATARYGILAVLERRRSRSASMPFEERYASYWWRCLENVLLAIIVTLALLRPLIETFPLNINDIGTLAIWAHLYFAACSQPPPKKWRQPKLAPQGA